ncbi:MAG: hypothetical protein AB7N76_16130 [Planctomycetota bacterium]
MLVLVVVIGFVVGVVVASPDHDLVDDHDHERSARKQLNPLERSAL